jgi:hypothetical protein
MTTDDESITNEVEKRLPKMDAEQKLWSLRSDALGLIIKIDAIAALFEVVDLENVKDSPGEFSNLVEQLNTSIHSLRRILDKYTAEE